MDVTGQIATDQGSGASSATVRTQRWTFLIWVLRIVLLPELAIAALMTGSMLYKIHLMQPAADGPIGGAVMQHDAKLFAIILVLYALGGILLRWMGKTQTVIACTRILARITLAGCLALILLYEVDVFVYHFFVTRLYAADIVTFSGEIHGGLTLLHTGLRTMLTRRVWKVAALFTAIALVLRALALLVVRGPSRYFRIRIIAIAILPFLAVAWWPHAESAYGYDDKPLYENVIERNKDYFVSSSFSDDFRRNLLAAPVPQACYAGEQKPVNVIILLVESLSAYQSKYFSGVEDWTPRLDAIAQQETALPNYYANGWTTIGGMLSLLMGTFPLVPEHAAFNVYGSPRYGDFSNEPASVPETLLKQGYVTEYVGGGDMGFMGKGSWLDSIGFQKVIGGDDPRYSQQKIRGPFNSVPDRLLYDVASDELSKMPKDKPYFVLVQTWWSHRPFMDANGQRLSGAEPVMRETDAEIGKFYERLKASGFLDNGVLIIMGDHRAPEPFEKAEFQRFGMSATARIPGVVATRAIALPHVISDNFQQTDVGPSVQSLISGRYCLGPDQGTFLGNPIRPPSCVIQSRGDDRDLIYVRCGADEGLVRLAGDKTRFIKGQVPDEAAVLETINRTRARP
jgi:lipoteichoic acid synthase